MKRILQLALLSVFVFGASVVSLALPTRFDFDNDHRADITVFRPSTGEWYILGYSYVVYQLKYGQAGDIPVAEYYFTGHDGRTIPAIYRKGLWALARNWSIESFDFMFGLDGDIPVPARYYKQSQQSEPAVFRNGDWYIQKWTGIFGDELGQVDQIHFGAAGDIPQPRDFDGDTQADYTVFRPSNGTWYIQGSVTGFRAVQFGTSGDIPVSGDYDGDGKADIAVYRPSDGNWYILGSTSGFYVVHFGISTDKPVPADYDGDNKIDVAVYRDGMWYILGSKVGFSATQFGLATDIPIPYGR